jgi:hypothetical protein
MKVAVDLELTLDILERGGCHITRLRFRAHMLRLTMLNNRRDGAHGPLQAHSTLNRAYVGRDRDDADGGVDLRSQARRE